MTAPVFTPTFHGGPAQGPKVELTLGQSGGSIDMLIAQIQRWAPEPPFAGVTEILLNMLTVQGLIELNADQARALVPELHRFADQLGDLADQLDTLGGQ